jgi:transposase
MHTFRLTDAELFELRVAHKEQSNKRAAYRINAVILLGSGWKLKQVKEALLLDDETLRSYVQKYTLGGVKGLLEINYSGRQNTLTGEQQAKLCAELETNIHLTAHSVIEFVVQSFGVTYSVSGMRDMLHRLGYTFKKPTLVPGNPDREKQEEFVMYYETFMEIKAADEEILFVDAVHPEHNTMAAYGWIKKGHKRCLKTNSGRQRLNLHGAINIETMKITIIESNTVNADSTIELLETLSQQYPLSSKLHIILDNARYHYSVKVKAYLESNSRINLVFLPAYSPELNLIERVWRYFKKNVLYNKYYADIKEFRAATIAFFKDIASHKKNLTTLLGGGFEGFGYT